MKDTVDRDRELARIWEQLEKYRKELSASGPDTTEAYERSLVVMRRMDEFEAEYKALGGILYDSHHRSGAD
jgi:hypothetical protein